MSDLQILSLGAGVQSTTVLLMSIAGELEPLDAAIFADTGWEPVAVYKHLDWLEARAIEAGIPVHRVTAGNIREDALDAEHRFASMPLFVKNEAGRTGMIRRQCTKEYKLTPIRSKVRQLLWENGRERAVQWIGISLDEAHRMRDADRKYIARNYYPLVDHRMTRHDCLRWLAARGYPEPPKSACIGCPFHGDSQWRRLRDEAPEDWADAVQFDEQIRQGNVRLRKDGQTDLLRGQAYLHRSLLPLAQVDLSTLADHGQGELFGQECEGMCGV